MFSFEDTTGNYFVENSTFDIMSDTNELNDNDYSCITSEPYPSASYISDGVSSASSSATGSPYDIPAVAPPPASAGSSIPSTVAYPYPSYYNTMPNPPTMTAQNMGSFGLSNYSRMTPFGEQIPQVGTSLSSIFSVPNALSSGLPPINNGDSTQNFQPTNTQSQQQQSIQQQQQQQAIQQPQPQHPYSMFQNYGGNSRRMMHSMNGMHQQACSYGEDYMLVNKIPRLQTSGDNQYSKIIATTATQQPSVNGGGSVSMGSVSVSTSPQGTTANGSMTGNVSTSKTPFESYAQRAIPQSITAIKSSPTLNIPPTITPPQQQQQSLPPTMGSSMNTTTAGTTTAAAGTTIMPPSSLPPLMMPSQSPQHQQTLSLPPQQQTSTSTAIPVVPPPPQTSQIQHSSPLSTQQQQATTITASVPAGVSPQPQPSLSIPNRGIKPAYDNRMAAVDVGIINDNDEDSPIKIIDSNGPDDLTKDTSTSHIKRTLSKDTTTTTNSSSTSNTSSSSSSTTLSTDALILVKGPSKPAVPGEKVPPNAPPFILKGLPPPAIFGGKMPHVSRRSRKRPKKEPTEDTPEDDDSDQDSPERLAVRLPRETLLNITSTDMLRYVKYLRENYVLTTEQEKELKHQKRLVKNRESARNSRQKKQDQISDLQAEIEVLKQEISQLKEQNNTLIQENIALKASAHKGCDTVNDDDDADTGTSADSNSNNSSSKNTAGKAFRLTGILFFAMLFSIGMLLDKFQSGNINNAIFINEKSYQHEHIPHIVSPGAGRTILSYEGDSDKSKNIFGSKKMMSHQADQDQSIYEYVDPKNSYMTSSGSSLTYEKVNRKKKGEENNNNFDVCRSDFRIRNAFDIKKPFWNPLNYSYIITNNAKQIYPEKYDREFGSKYLGVILPVSTFCSPMDRVSEDGKSESIYMAPEDDMVGLTCRVVDGSVIPLKSPLLKEKNRMKN